jgi:hypothetical protein
VVRGAGVAGDGEPMTLRVQVHVAGRLPQALTETAGTRFGEIAVRMQPTCTMLAGRVADQAALRALLNLIWDTGASVLSVTSTATSSQPTTDPLTGKYTARFPI